jgi:hypothetical protein
MDWQLSNTIGIYHKYAYLRKNIPLNRGQVEGQVKLDRIWKIPVPKESEIGKLNVGEVEQELEREEIAENVKIRYSGKRIPVKMDYVEIVRGRAKLETFSNLVKVERGSAKIQSHRGFKVLYGKNFALQIIAKNLIPESEFSRVVLLFFCVYILFKSFELYSHYLSYRNMIT